VRSEIGTAGATPRDLRARLGLDSGRRRALAPLTDEQRARLLQAQAEVRHLRAISMVQIASDAAFDPTEGSPTRSRGSQSGVGTRAHFDADSGRYRRSSWALAIASLLEWTPSLRRMCLMWLCTVSSETTSSFEIS
jgi:hypothetical protein